MRVDLPEGTRVGQVAAGEFHSVAVTWNDRALAWGANNVGQLGEGTNAAHTVPWRVKLPVQLAATQVTGGYAHTVALTEIRAR